MVNPRIEITKRQSRVIAFPAKLILKSQESESAFLVDERHGFWIVQSKNGARASQSDRSSATESEYGIFQKAYRHFNATLFDSSLPDVMITLQRQRGARGYFSPDRFRCRQMTSNRVHELALNPDTFVMGSDEEILSTFVHEMAHVAQQEYGHPGRRGYHNRQWAAMMHAIGLMPSSTGEPGGKITGDRVSHYILDDGPFIVACREFLTHHEIIWESAVNAPPEIEAEGAGTQTKQTRARFTCPNCGLNIWAKPVALVACYLCSLEAQELVPMIVL